MYRIIQSQDELINRVLPETGLKKTVRLINYNQNSANIIIIFKAAGASAFFKEPLHEFFEKSIPLEDIIKRTETERIEEQLVLAKDNYDRISIIEQFLLTKFQNRKPDQLVEAALQRIHITNGQYPIIQLAYSLHISQDAFEKRFRKVVGASPKQFSSIIRMKSIISQKQKTVSFTEMALNNGYFDQSHFNKDFKLFTGLSPTDFYKSHPRW
jgi:AraC-like DNA-binding protein